MAPTANGQGLRLRLLGTERKQAGGYATSNEAPEGYAVNLESSLEKFDPSAVQAAAAQLGATAYVSETDIEDKHWYRLRVGPFTTRVGGGASAADRADQLSACLARHQR